MTKRHIALTSDFFSDRGRVPSAKGPNRAAVASSTVNNMLWSPDDEGLSDALVRRGDLMRIE